MGTPITFGAYRLRGTTTGHNCAAQLRGAVRVPGHRCKAVQQGHGYRQRTGPIELCHQHRQGSLLVKPRQPPVPVVVRYAVERGGILLMSKYRGIQGWKEDYFWARDGACRLRGPP